MAKYINRMGEYSNERPTATYKVPDDIGVNVTYKVMAFEGVAEMGIVILGEEDYENYPTDDQIIYTMIKYKADQAQVRKVYQITGLPEEEENDI